DGSFGDLAQGGNAIVIVDCRKCALLTKFLCNLRSRHELQCRRWYLGQGPLNVGIDEPLIARLNVTWVGLPIVIQRKIKVFQAKWDSGNCRGAIDDPWPHALLFRPVQTTDCPVMIWLNMVEYECEIDAALKFPQAGCFCFNQLKQEQFARLQFWILWLNAERKHRFLDALINLCWSHVESSHSLRPPSKMERYSLPPVRRRCRQTLAPRPGPSSGVLPR